MTHKTKAVVFEQVRLIQIGSVADGDPNVCNFNYETTSTVKITKTSVEFDFINKVNAPTDNEDSMKLRFNAELLEDGMVNIKINYASEEKMNRFTIKDALDTTSFKTTDDDDI